MKNEKLNKGKEFVKDHGWDIVKGLGAITLVVGGGFVLTKISKKSEWDKVYENFIDMNSKANWGHVGAGSDGTWKVEDLGKFGEFLIKRFEEDGCLYVKPDSEVIGIHIIGMKSKS